MSSMTKTAESIGKCDQDGAMVIHVTKVSNIADAKQFNALRRVLSNIVKAGD